MNDSLKTKPSINSIKLDIKKKKQKTKLHSTVHITINQPQSLDPRLRTQTQNLKMDRKNHSPNGFCAFCSFPPNCLLSFPLLLPLAPPVAPLIPPPIVLPAPAAVFPTPWVAPETVFPRPEVASPAVLPRLPTRPPAVDVTPVRVWPSVSPMPETRLSKEIGDG